MRFPTLLAIVTFGYLPVSHAATGKSFTGWDWYGVNPNPSVVSHSHEPLAANPAAPGRPTFVVSSQSTLSTNLPSPYFAFLTFPLSPLHPRKLSLTPTDPHIQRLPPSLRHQQQQAEQRPQRHQRLLLRRHRLPLRRLHAFGRLRHPVVRVRDHELGQLLQVLHGDVAEWQRPRQAGDCPGDQQL